jgi:hypothetical protein
MSREDKLILAGQETAEEKYEMMEKQRVSEKWARNTVMIDGKICMKIEEK